MDLNLSDTITIEESDQTTFASFLDWISNYNDYVLSSWNDSNKRSGEINAAWDLPDDQALDVVEQFVNIEDSGAEAVQ